MTATHHRRRVRGAAIVLLACTALAGCKGKDPSGQVLAVVDGHEVTTAQFNLLLAGVPNEAARNNHAIQAAAAKELIDETLLMSEAERAGLDKDPNVTRQIDRARRSVLASAYVHQIAPSGPISPADVEAFYNAHPWYFSERRHYVITDAPVSGGAEVERFLPAFNAPNAKLDDVLAQMKAAGIDVTTKQAPVNADQLPDEMAKQMAKMSAGDNFTFRIGPVRHFGRVDSIEPSPVPLAAVRDKIVPVLQQKRLADAVKAKVDALRAQRKIEMGEVGKQIMAAANTPNSPAIAPPPAVPSAKQAESRGINGL